MGWEMVTSWVGALWILMGWMAIELVFGAGEGTDFEALLH